MDARKSAVALAAVLAACSPSEDASPPGQESPHDAPWTTELVSVYVGATFCGPCQTPEMKQAIRTVQLRLAEQVTGTARRYAAVGVSLDEAVDEGVTFLRGTASFDEIVVGRNWANSAVIDLIWAEPDGQPQLPQLIVFERKIREGYSRMEIGPKRIIRRLVGAEEIPRWAVEGAPLESLGIGVSGT